MDGVYRDLTWLRPRTRLLWVWGGLVSSASQLKKLDMMQRTMVYI